MIHRGKLNGLPVVDAKETLIVNVSDSDISKASIKAPGKCAFARACKRQLPILEARVHLSRVYLRFNDKQWMRYFTPRDLRGEIIAFDRGGTFAAGEYTLSKPWQEAGHGQGDAKEKTKRLKKVTSNGIVVKPRRTRHVTGVRHSPF